MFSDTLKKLLRNPNVHRSNFAGEALPSEICCFHRQQRRQSWLSEGPRKCTFANPWNWPEKIHWDCRAMWTMSNLSNLLRVETVTICNSWKSRFFWEDLTFSHLSLKRAIRTAAGPGKFEQRWHDSITTVSPCILRYPHASQLVVILERW